MLSTTVDPMIYLKTPQQQKRHMLKRDHYSQAQKMILPCLPHVDHVKELTEKEFSDQQIHLIS